MQEIWIKKEEKKGIMNGIKHGKERGDNPTVITNCIEIKIIWNEREK